MDAVEFMSERNRMCDSIGCYCGECELNELRYKYSENCNNVLMYHTEEAVAKVENWSKSHPRKTILDDFKEKYPSSEYITNQSYQKNGYPVLCPKLLGYNLECNDAECCSGNCYKKWDTPMDEVE